MAHLLEVNNLKKHFILKKKSLFNKKEVILKAVDGISLYVDQGETLGLVGESGCGKSTALRTISQLYKATEGSILLDDEELTKMSHSQLIKRRRHLQLVFQDPQSCLNPLFTVETIIAEPLVVFRNHGLLSMTHKEIQERVHFLMAKVGLPRHTKNRYPHEFSGGQRQRIGIARALALSPKLILADEPVSALDVSIQAQILNLFKDLQDEFNLAYFFVAHDLSVINYVSHRIAVMYLGKIMELAWRKDLYAQPLHPYTQALLSAIPLPDPVLERKKQRIILSGDLPSPIGNREGCYFYDRCDKRMAVCAHYTPELKEVEKGHFVACFLYFEP